MLLAESAADLFDTEVTPELLEAADRGEWPEKLWRILDEADYPRLFAEPGVTWADAYPLVEAAGNALLPVPLPEALAASWLLSQAGIEQPGGIVTVIAQPPGWLAENRNGAWYVSGTASGVPWAHAAEHAVVIARASGEPVVALLATAELRIEPGLNAAHEPRDDVTATEAKAVACAPLGGLSTGILYEFGALTRATQMAGALRRILRITAHYAGERTQFGRPIGQFQAISQQLAVLAEESTAATIAAAFAWAEAAEDPETPAIAVAKVRTGQAAGTSAAIAHAVFGAIGITAEHSLHFATRRLWCWRAEYGPERFWAHALGATIVRQGSARLWPGVTVL